MKILDLIQGSPEWLAARPKYRCASEAPAMMGASSRMKRTELIRLKQTGTEKEYSEWVKENLLAKGHIIEAAVRPMIEAQLGEDLYPVCGSCDADYLMASYDGLTMMSDTAIEVKSWNKELAAAVMAKSIDLPDGHHWQLEQQLLVGAPALKRVIFVCSDGTEGNTVWMEYRPVPGRAQQLMAGWKQFDEDVQTYQHVEEAPKPMAQPTMALPAVSIQVRGEIVLVDNLKVFGERLKSFIEAIDKDPRDDQAFADAEAACKTLQTAQDALEAAEASALAQTASVDEMRRTVAYYRDLARTTRLSLEKIVKVKKDQVREDIRRNGSDALDEHIFMLNKRLGKPYMPPVRADFAGVMKGKKTLASLRDAVHTELARAKIEANEIADRIEINLKTLAQHPDYTFLFADAAQIVLKPNEDFAALVKLRIAEHKEAEAKRLEQERERIRQEEAARIRREEEDRIRREEAVRIAEANQARAAEEARQRQERERIEAEARAKADAERKVREEQEARQRAERDAKEAQQRKAREEEEARQREVQRQANEQLDARTMLATFVQRFGHMKQYAAVVAEINAVLTPKKKKAA